MNCGPRGLPFDRNILYHNDGGVFRDVSDESGVSKPDGNYSLGVLTGDFNGGGLTDIYVASDQTPSTLYINQGNGKFVDEALLRGVALDDNGQTSRMARNRGRAFQRNWKSGTLRMMNHSRGKPLFSVLCISITCGQTKADPGMDSYFRRQHFLEQSSESS